MRFVIGTACAALACVLLSGAGSFRAGEKKEPKYAIKDVMNAAHEEEGLLETILAGKGDKADGKKLLELYTALSQNKPPMGAREEWVKTTQKMIAAARLAAEGDPGAAKALKAAVKCAACHKQFKGS